MSRRRPPGWPRRLYLYGCGWVSLLPFRHPTRARADLRERRHRNPITHPPVRAALHAAQGCAAEGLAMLARFSGTK